MSAHSYCWALLATVCCRDWPRLIQMLLEPRQLGQNLTPARFNHTSHGTATAEVQLPFTSDAVARLGTRFGPGRRFKSGVLCPEPGPFTSSQVPRGLLGSQGWLGEPWGSSKAFPGLMRVAFPHLVWDTTQPSISPSAWRRKSRRKAALSFPAHLIQVGICVCERRGGLQPSRLNCL